MNVNPQGPGAPSKKSMSVALIVALVFAALGGCCVVGVLAAIAIPNFMKYQGKSKQAECKVNLRNIYQAEDLYFEQHQDYSQDFNAIGMSPTGNRYTYFIGPTTVKTPSVPGSVAVSLDALPALAGGAVVGVEGTCPHCTFTAACAGNLDKDSDLDVWSISTAVRGAVRAGEVSHDVDDL